MESNITLYPFQKTGIDWIKPKSKCILADSMGLGKTLVSLMARQHDSVNIICPSSVKQNWAREITKFTDLKPIVLKGLNSFTFANPGEAIISNPEIIPDFAFQPNSPVTIIIDECHSFRNNRPIKYANMKYIIRRAGIDSQCIGLSATPLVNRITDLINLIDLIGLSAHFDGKDGFAKMLSSKIGKRGDIRNPVISQDFLARLSEIMLRREKEDVLDDLPDKIYSVYEVDSWSKSLNNIMDDGLSSLEAYEKMNGTIQPGSLPPLAELSRARHAIAKEKIPHAEIIVSKIMGNDKQVLLYSAHVDPVNHFGDRSDWGKISGEISTNNRQKASDNLKDGKIKALALTLQAGGVGLNLQSCDETVFVDLSYSLSDNVQALGRTDRIGQKSKCIRYTYITMGHPLDVRMAQICLGKMQLFKSVLDPICSKN